MITNQSTRTAYQLEITLLTSFTVRSKLATVCTNVLDLISFFRLQSPSIFRHKEHLLVTDVHFGGQEPIPWYCLHCCRLHLLHYWHCFPRHTHQIRETVSRGCVKSDQDLCAVISCSKSGNYYVASSFLQLESFEKCLNVFCTRVYCRTNEMMEVGGGSGGR